MKTLINTLLFFKSFRLRPPCTCYKHIVITYILKTHLNFLTDVTQPVISAILHMGCLNWLRYITKGILSIWHTKERDNTFGICFNESNAEMRRLSQIHFIFHWLFSNTIILNSLQTCSSGLNSGARFGKKNILNWPRCTCTKSRTV